MSIDTTALSQTALDLIERLAEDHEDDDREIGVVALVVEINGEDATWIEYRCSDQRKWIQAGLFDRAKAATLYGD